MNFTFKNLKKELFGATLGNEANIKTGERKFEAYFQKEMSEINELLSERLGNKSAFKSNEADRQRMLREGKEFSEKREIADKLNKINTISDSLNSLFEEANKGKIAKAVKIVEKIVIYQAVYLVMRKRTQKKILGV